MVFSVSAVADRLPETGGFKIKGRRKEPNPFIVTIGNQIMVRLPGKLQALQHGKLRLHRTGRLLLVSRLGGVFGNQILCPEGLKLDRIGPGRHGGIHQLESQLPATVMIDSGLGNNPNR